MVIGCSSRFRAFVFTVAVAVLPLVFPLATSGLAPVRLTIGDTTVGMTVVPYLVNGTVMVPVAEVASIMGYRATWDAQQRTVGLYKGQVGVMTLKVGSAEARYGSGQKTRLPEPVIIVNNRSMAPLEAFLILTGAQAEYKQGKTVVKVTKPATAGQPSASTLSASAELAAPPMPLPVVMAYYPEDYPGDLSAYDSLTAFGTRIDLVAYFGYHLDEKGNLSGWRSTRLEEAIRSKGSKLLLTIHNAKNGTFDRAAVHRFLSNPAARKAGVRNLAKAMSSGFAGINLDLEAVPAADRSLYTAFVGELATELHAAGKLLTLAIPAKSWDDPSNAWSGAFDYQALGSVADFIVIMAYDEHWVGGNPGPIASINWVENVAAYVSRTIPPQKALLGIPAYAYDWPANGGGTGGARAMGAKAAKQLAAALGAQVSWDDMAQVPYFIYQDKNGQKRVVYFEDARSAQAKLGVVRRYGFGGVAIWRLGFEDPRLWDVLATTL